LMVMDSCLVIWIIFAIHGSCCILFAAEWYLAQLILMVMDSCLVIWIIFTIIREYVTTSHFF
jgi:hypothetical protein